MDIRELMVHIRANSSNRQVEKDTGMDRRTVKRYREWAREQGLLEGDLPPIETVQAKLEQSMPMTIPPQNASTVEPYREEVEKMVKQNVEAAAIWERLKERGYRGSYAAVYRFVKPMRGSKREAFTRVERQPGEEAQVDFGYAGLMIDPESGQKRRAWAFVMTLSWSRHQYVEFVWDQKVETWLLCHSHALEFFGGVPKRVTPDNLKAGIIRASWDDPQIQQSYRYCAEHYGFLIAPCRPMTPEHKGKVEQGGVHYVKRNFLGGREPTSITRANREVKAWCLTTAGLRIHGTTKEKPLVRFEETEKDRLKPLPHRRYDLMVWKKVKLGRDCYVTFNNAYYSAPYRLVGQELWVCGGLQQVRIYNLKHELIATHDRAKRPGERLTHLDHIPPHKVAGLIIDWESCLGEAEAIGSATLQVVQHLQADPVVDRLYTAGRLVRLSQKLGAERLEAACSRALIFGDPAYKTVKRILTQGLENAPLPVLATPPAASAFVRSAEELVGHLWEGETWS